MIRRFSIVLPLFLLALTARTQTLLNADSDKIKKEMLSHGGILNGSVIEDDFEMANTHYHKMFFAFPQNRANGIFDMVFCFTLKNKCFKYYVSYYGDQWVKKLKDSLNKPSSGVKQVKDSLKWVTILLIH